MNFKLFKTLGSNLQRIYPFSSPTELSRFDLILNTFRSGDFNKIKSAIDSVNLASEEYSTLLHYVIATKGFDRDIKIQNGLEYMLHKGALINKPAGPNGPTALLVSVLYENDEAFKLLLQHGADPDIPGDIGKSIHFRKNAPLHLTVDHGDLKMTQLLIDHRATIDPINAAGETPLHRAGLGKNPAIMHKLLDQGADLYIKCRSSGMTALDYINLNEALRDSYLSRDPRPTFSK